MAGCVSKVILNGKLGRDPEPGGTRSRPGRRGPMPSPTVEPELDPELLADALRLLGPRAARQRHAVTAAIREIVARFRQDARADGRRLPPRRERRRALRRIADDAERVYDGLAALPLPDRLGLDVAADPEIQAVGDALARADLTAERVLVALAAAARAAASDVPGAAGGPTAELARPHLAERCLALFLRFRAGPLSAAARDGYVAFVGAVHALATDAEADLERAAKAARRARRRGVPGARVGDAT